MELGKFCQMPEGTRYHLVWVGFGFRVHGLDTTLVRSSSVNFPMSASGGTETWRAAYARKASRALCARGTETSNSPLTISMCVEREIQHCS